MGLSFAEKVILTKKIDFPRLGTKMYNVFIWHTPISQNLDFFQIAWNFFSCPFPFSRPFHSRYLFCFIIFLAAVKSWVFIMGKAWNGTLINYRYIGPFYDRFSPKWIKLFNLLRQNPKPPVVRIDLF